MPEYTLKVSLKGQTWMNGLDHYDLNERIEKLRYWLPNIDLVIEVDEVQSEYGQSIQGSPIGGDPSFGQKITSHTDREDGSSDV